MSPKLKNTIIFLSIGIVLVIVYLVFLRGGKEDSGSQLASTTPNTLIPEASTATNAGDFQIAKDFLATLLSVRSITIDDAIFSDVAFLNLKDSSILLLPDGTEGRPNPFAPIGEDVGDLSSSSASSLVSGSSSMGASSISGASSATSGSSTQKGSASSGSSSSSGGLLNLNLKSKPEGPSN